MRFFVCVTIDNVMNKLLKKQIPKSEESAFLFLNFKVYLSLSTFLLSCTIFLDVRQSKSLFVRQNKHQNDCKGTIFLP